jgi:hypothetical protein
MPSRFFSMMNPLPSHLSQKRSYLPTMNRTRKSKANPTPRRPRLTIGDIMKRSPRATADFIPSPRTPVVSPRFGAGRKTRKQKK